MKSCIRSFTKVLSIAAFVFPLLFISEVRAEYVGGAQLTIINTAEDGFVLFGVNAPPASTCNFWGFQFRFDGNTVAGKNMLANLMLAKAINKPIDLVFAAAAQPGTFAYSNPTGCTNLNMARVSVIVVN
jgi:hypothetical protein